MPNFDLAKLIERLTERAEEAPSGGLPGLAFVCLTDLRDAISVLKTVQIPYPSPVVDADRRVICCRHCRAKFVMQPKLPKHDSHVAAGECPMSGTDNFLILDGSDKVVDPPWVNPPPADPELAKQEAYQSGQFLDPNAQPVTQPGFSDPFTH